MQKNTMVHCFAFWGLFLIPNLPCIYPFFSQYTIKGSSSPLTPPNVTLTLNDNSKEFNSLRGTEKSYQSYLYFKIVDFKCMLFIVDAVRYGALPRAFYS